MKKNLCNLLAIVCLSLPFSAFAQSGDAMKQDNGKQDTMKQDQMQNDQMKHDNMSKDKKSAKNNKKMMKKNDQKKEEPKKEEEKKPGMNAEKRPARPPITKRWIWSADGTIGMRLSGSRFSHFGKFRL